MGSASSRDAFLARERSAGAAAHPPPRRDSQSGSGSQAGAEPARNTVGARPAELSAALAALAAAEDAVQTSNADGAYTEPRALWSRPVPPPAMFRTDTIKNDVNLKKNTLRLVRDEENPNLYLIEFVFDAIVDGDITVYICARETTCLEVDKRLRFEGRYQKKPNKTRFKQGFGQVYRQKRSRALDLSEYTREELEYDGKSDVYPIIIRLEAAQTNPDRVTDDTEINPSSSTVPSKSRIRSQCSFATLRVVSEKSTDQGAEPVYGIELISQKILVGDTTYELQEIYGIQNAAGTSAEDAGQAEADQTQVGDGATAINLDDGAECVICLSDTRDTVVLPCRHLCLCEECALRLRSRSNKCPVCRSRVDSLLQIKDIWSSATETNKSAVESAEIGAGSVGSAAPSMATTAEADVGGSNMSTTVEASTSVVSHTPSAVEAGSSAA